jgi:hypothetical protein
MSYSVELNGMKCEQRKRLIVQSHTLRRLARIGSALKRDWVCLCKRGALYGLDPELKSGKNKAITMPSNTFVSTGRGRMCLFRFIRRPIKTTKIKIKGFISSI